MILQKITHVMKINYLDVYQKIHMQYVIQII